MSERTLVLIKPDGVRRRLVGEVIGRIERKGLAIVALEQRVLPRELVEEHYAEHRGKPFYDGLVAFMTSGPVVALVVEGFRAIEVLRVMMGVTDPAKAAPGTIRGDLSTDFGNGPQENVTHGSDSAASAEREIKLFFPHLA